MIFLENVLAESHGSKTILLYDTNQILVYMDSYILLLTYCVYLINFLAYI